LEGTVEEVDTGRQATFLSENELIAFLRENFAQTRQSDQRIDVGLRPKRLQKLILRDQAVRVFDQVSQNIECLGSKGCTLVSSPQTVVHRVKPE